MHHTHAHNHSCISPVSIDALKQCENSPLVLLAVAKLFLSERKVGSEVFGHRGAAVRQGRHSLEPLLYRRFQRRDSGSTGQSSSAPTTAMRGRTTTSLSCRSAFKNLQLQGARPLSAAMAHVLCFPPFLCTVWQRRTTAGGCQALSNGRAPSRRNLAAYRQGIETGLKPWAWLNCSRPWVHPPAFGFLVFLPLPPNFPRSALSIRAASF